MTAFRVQITNTALAAIEEQARHISEQEEDSVYATRWLQTIWDAVDSLEHSSKRSARSQESAYVEYEVRQLVVGKHLLLFTIDDLENEVVVVGIRHSHRTAHVSDLQTDD